MTNNELVELKSKLLDLIWCGLVDNNKLYNILTRAVPNRFYNSANKNNLLYYLAENKYSTNSWRKFRHVAQCSGFIVVQQKNSESDIL